MQTQSLSSCSLISDYSLSFSYLYPLVSTMLFSSFITFATFAATVSASAFDLSDDPLFAQAHGMSHKEYKSFIYRKNQYNPHRSPSKPLRARQAAASPNCSATKKCGSKTEFCSHLGFCMACPNQGIQNAAGNGCECIEGYEVVSRSGVSYCECANTVKGALTSLCFKTTPHLNSI